MCWMAVNHQFLSILVSFSACKHVSLARPLIISTHSRTTAPSNHQVTKY